MPDSRHSDVVVADYVASDDAACKELEVTAPILFVRSDQLALSASNPYLWGAAAAITAAYKTGNIYWTIGAGMLVFVAAGQLI